VAVSFLTAPYSNVFDPEEVADPNRDLAAADTGFTGPDIETDQQAIAETIFASLAARVPGWEANDANPDTWLIEAFAMIAAELRALAANVPGAVISTYGVEVLGLPIRAPAPAVGLTRWTAEDDRGYQIRPGLQLTVARTGDELVGFEVVSGGEIPPGDTVTEGVPVRAVLNGAHANGLIGEAEMSDPLDWVRSVEIVQPTVQGDDGQTGEEYLGNLSNLLRVVAFRPVLPWDFALLAMQVPGCHRAVAMNGYEPDDDTWGHQRQVTVAVGDRDSEPLPEPVKDQIRDSLELAREVNFRVPIVDFEYEEIDVEFEVTMFAEQDEQAVLDICTDAVEQLLAPGGWRLGTTSPGIAAGEVIPPPAPGTQPGRMTIRRNDVIGLLYRCRGVDWVDEVLIDGQAADRELTGPTTLPRPGTISGTVNAQ
jgi:hypothetical protein